MSDTRTKVDALKDLGEKLTGKTIEIEENETIVSMLDKITAKYNEVDWVTVDVDYTAEEGGYKLLAYKYLPTGDYPVKLVVEGIGEDVPHVRAGLRLFDSNFEEIGRISNPDFELLTNATIEVDAVSDADYGEMTNKEIIEKIGAEGMTTRYFVEGFEIPPEPEWIEVLEENPTPDSTTGVTALGFKYQESDEYPLKLILEGGSTDATVGGATLGLYDSSWTWTNQLTTLEYGFTVPAGQTVEVDMGAGYGQDNVQARQDFITALATATSHGIMFFNI